MSSPIRLALLSGALLAAVAHAAPAERPKLAVLDLAVAGEVTPEVAGALSEAIAADVSALNVFDVVSAKDVATLLGVERRKQLLGCAEEGSCLTELAGALGARFVLSGSLARLGNTYQLTLQTLDTRTTRPVGRAVRLAKSLDALQGTIPYALAEATGTPPPPSPSHLPSYALMGGGGLVLASGAVIGIIGLNQEAAVKKELDLGATSPFVLKPVDYYRAQASSLRVQKTLSLAGLVAGAALIGVGYWLNPRDSGERVAVGLSASGLSFAGTLQ